MVLLPNRVLTILAIEGIVIASIESSEGHAVEKQYLTASEVAALLRISPQTVSSWCREGRLKAIRAGRVWRIRPADLEEFTHKGIPQSGESPKASGLALSY
ncbi:MAG: helix-turn-helix domain-containing protein [Kouleothrix sp.]|jgi:excisionase family DNA binding protein|nr:helix-turn-helix domain-containing protein [Kouleothrix sp.]